MHRRTGWALILTLAAVGVYANKTQAVSAEPPTTAAPGRRKL